MGLDQEKGCDAGMKGCYLGDLIRSGDPSDERMMGKIEEHS